MLSALILGANHRRPANRVWAWFMAITGVWQCGIGLAQLYHAQIFLRFGIFAAFILLWTLPVLYEAILNPWASLRRHVARHWRDLWVVVYGLIVFTDWFMPWSSTDEHRVRGVMYYVTDCLALAWVLRALVRAVLDLRSGRTAPRARSEVRALLGMLVLGSVPFIVINIIGNLSHVRYSGWLSPVAAFVGLIVGGWRLLDTDVLAVREKRKASALLLIRAFAYAVASAVLILGVRWVAAAGTSATVFYAAVVALALGVQPSADRWMRRWVDRRFTPRSLVETQLAINALTHAATDFGTLHDGYCEILRRWSDGSEHVFLSEGAFAPKWPAQAIPPRLLALLQTGGHLTPEQVERLGREWRDEFDYLLRHEVAAMVSVVNAAGDRLVAAFSVRSREGPYTEAELHEARELLAAMLTGAHLLRVRQRLRGADRLNFYARYAPQFAHELRNGLYLQTQLMRAIASGRGADVEPADARAGLERTEQIDRLCDHFFNVGTLFNRPIERVSMASFLRTFAERMQRQFDGGGALVLRLEVEPPSQAEIYGNSELLNMALLNLVKNAFESGEGNGSGPTVELRLVRQMDKIHLLVRDTGPGLPPDRRADPFAPGRSHKRDGMGLGLSIVRDCVEAMGGTIGLQFTGSAGTCFEITLACAARFDGAAAPCAFLSPAG